MLTTYEQTHLQELVPHLSGNVLLVVDTDSYVGNFDRELGAFVTGLVGDFYVAENFVNEGLAKAKFKDWYSSHVKLHDEPDYRDAYGVASKWPTPGRYNNGRGESFDGDCAPQGRYCSYESLVICFDEVPPDEVKAEIKERIHQFCKSQAIMVKAMRYLKLDVPEAADVKVSAI